MKELSIAILGATGAVGEESIRILGERKLPIKELRLLCSSKNAGQKIAFGSETLITQKANEDSFKGIDIVLSAVSAELSEIFTPMANKAGAIVIDNSSRYRMVENVPLVIPEINAEDISKHNGIIANPNCTTIITLVAVNAINRYSPIQRLVASSYQAVSGAGKEGISELEEQSRSYAAGDKPVTKVFRHQILHNMIPHIDSFCENLYTKEEMKLANEGRKILHSPDIKIACTCVRVPALRSHSVSVMLETADELSVEKARELIGGARGVELRDDVFSDVYPMPLDSSGQDLVYVGRIRRDISGKGLMLWCCGDQIRKGAATNAVQIAELLYRE